MATPATPSPTPAPRAPVSSPAWHFLLLVALGGVLFFVGLGRLPLLEPDEGRNAEVAREMLVSGNWLTPHYDTFTYLDKPAVFFWMVAAAFRMGGVSEWTARAPSALMALATLFLAWFLARRMFGNSTALRAGVVLATCPLVMGFARLVIFDMTLTFLVSAAMTCFWVAEREGFRRAWLDVLMFAAMGVATITKGPVGFLLPLLSILLCAALGGRVRELKRLRWGLGVLVFLAAALPWFVAVSIRHPEFPRYALWQESLVRFTAGHVRRGGSIFYYLPVFLAGFFPWSLFIVFAGAARLRVWRVLREEENRATLFLLSWVLLIFVFFTISHSKLPGYFLPAMIPLSILMARAWAEVGTTAESRAPDWLKAGFATLLGVGLVLALLSQPWLLAGEKARLAKRLHPSVMAMLRPSLIYTGLILGAIAIIGRNLASRGRGKFLAAATLALVALVAPLVVVRWWTPLQTFAATTSSRQLAQALATSSEKDYPIYGYYYFRTGLPFYLRRPVGLITEDGGQITSNYISARWRELRREASKETPAPTSLDIARALGSTDAGRPDLPLMMDGAELQARNQSLPLPWLILVRNNMVGNLARAAPNIEPLWTGWDYSVWMIPAGRPAPREAAPARIISPFHP